MTDSETQPSLITLLVDQHRQVDECFTRLEYLARTGAETSDEARLLTERVIKDLVRHAVSEEVHLYPTVLQQLDGGHELADREVAEHKRAEQTMQRLEGLSVSDGEFRPALHELISRIRQHVHEEEAILFPRLQATCTEPELRELGRKCAGLQRMAPTRPHPSAPSEGGLLAGLAPGVGLVDRVRDALGDRPD